MRFFEWSVTEEELVAADLLALMCREDSERVTRIIKAGGHGARTVPGRVSQPRLG